MSEGIALIHELVRKGRVEPALAAWLSEERHRAQSALGRIGWWLFPRHMAHRLIGRAMLRRLLADVLKGQR